MTDGLTVLTHVCNEELLLPHWLRHHRRLFDHGVVVDRGSTDRTLEIVRELAPDWEIVPSRSAVFDARECDREMMALEARHRGWKIILNATEFLFHDDLEGHLRALEVRTPDVSALRVPMAIMVDPPERRDEPLTATELVLDRTHGRVETGLPALSRVLHRHPDGAYSPGRHGTGHAVVEDPELLVLRFTWSPHGPQRERKLAIQAAQPASDLTLGLGTFHCSTADQLDACHAQEARWSRDLREVPRYAALHERVRVRAGQPPRPARSTRDPRPAPEPPLTVRVVGDDARSRAIAARLRELPGFAVGEGAATEPAAAVVIPPTVPVGPLLPTLGLVIVDLRDPPECVPAEPPAVGIEVGPPGVALLARADYVLAPSSAALAPWTALLVASGRLDPATAGPEVLAIGEDVTPLAAFLRDPVRRGQVPAVERTIEVSERWVGFLYAWAMTIWQAQGRAPSS